MLDKAYDPGSTEDRIYALWEESGAFAPDLDAKEDPYCIIMPPPNANGDLHLGHAMYTVEDILTRFHRMNGHPTLWMPGTDHAGIETQVVFERKLEKDGRSRFDLGPEKFYDEVMKFTRENQGNIIDQLRKMGFSADWSKMKFTLDEDVIDIVYDTFIEMDRDGLVYRGNRVCNWCPRCQTSFADIEIKYQEEDGFMYTIDYGPVQIGTTRPETMFGDTAVAVNPNDDRYKDLIGTEAMIPLINKNISIVADQHVDPKVGTGALKVTPAHDFNDFEIGMRHNLDTVAVIDKEGRMIGVPEALEGIVTSEARKLTVEMLEKAGVLVSKEPLTHSVAHCDRCGTTIEPLPTDQWYVKVDTLKHRAKEAIEDGRVRIIPERFTKECLEWLDQMYDWNVSRQIWWGIRMPVFYPLEPQDGKKDYLIAKTEQEAEDYYGKGSFHAETDTFDTWFSSSQWPHATLKTNDLLDTFYPTTVMETGRDILFKWVARMIMLGLYKMDEVPFKDVYLHGMVRDEKGQKMSKSKGNVINPLEMTSEFGTDALRMALLIGVTPGNDGSLSTDKVSGYRNFVNKLWNASRFVLMQCESTGVSPAEVESGKWKVENLGLADKAILSSLQDLITDVTDGLAEYRLSDVGERLYSFTWDYFCDWYLELSKGEANPEVLVHVLRTIVTLLHPYCPFVTEELWSQIKPKDAGMLISEQWTMNNDQLKDQTAQDDLQTVIDVISAIRSLRSDQGIEAGKKVNIIIHSKHADLLTAQKEHILKMGRLEDLTIDSDAKKHEDAASAIIKDTEIYMPLEGLIDTEAEIAKLTKEKQKLEGFIIGSEAKLSNKKFVDGAPQDVITLEKEKLAGNQEKLKKVEERLQSLN